MREILETEKHLITQQHESEKKFLAELKKGDYTLENPLVVKNPYLINPLAAVICFKTVTETSVEIKVKGKTEEADLIHKFDGTKEHVLPVYGLYDDYENIIVLKLEDGREAEVRIPIEELDINKAHYCKTTYEYFGKDIMAISIATPLVESGRTCGFDFAGDLRWVITEKASWDIKKLSNGRLLVTSYRSIQKPYYTVGLMEMDFCGKIYNEYRLPGGYHHDAIELENGNLLVSSDNDFNDSVEDFVVEIDRETGKIIKSWNLQKVLPREEGKAGDWNHHDWFHNNSVWYDKPTNSITMSGRHQDAVINIDYDTGGLNWIIGDPEGWSKEMVDKYFFSRPSEGDFDWQYEQHSAMILPNGDVFVFDNGTYRAKVATKRIPPESNFSRGVIYRIDTEKMEVKQIWQYGKERGAEFYSPYICNVDYYDEGHYMIHSGGIATYRGKHTDQLGASLINEYKNEHIHLALDSITVEVLNDKVEYELNVKGSNYYRARRLSLYDKKTNLILGKGRQLGSFGVTPQFMKVKFNDVDGDVPEKNNLSLVVEEDRLALRGTFEEGSQVILELVKEDESRFYLVPTDVHDITAACVSFEEQKENDIQYYVSKEGLKGKFDIYLNVDNSRYDTKKTIEV